MKRFLGYKIGRFALYTVRDNNIIVAITEKKTKPISTRNANLSKTIKQNSQNK